MLGEVVTGNYFTMLGVRARIGRTLLPEDDEPQAARAVVLSNRYWRTEFGGDTSALGQTLKIRGQAFTIVGVLDHQFTGMVPMLAPEIWVPTQWSEDIEPAGINENVPSPTGTSRLDRRGQRWLFAKARLAEDASFDQARASMDLVAARLREEHPQTNKDRRVTLRPTANTRLHPEADQMLAWLVTGTMIAVGLVLAIACANVAGMLLARAAARHREIAIRLAVGANRRRLVRQLLTESVLLGSLGAIVGVLLAWWLTRLLTTFELPLPVPLSIDLRLDARVMAFTAAVAVLTGIVAGLAPALRATRSNLVLDLKADAGRGGGSRRWTARDVMVVGQMAVTIVLLVTAGLLVRSLVKAQSADVGFQTNGLAIVSADPGMLRYSAERSQQFWNETMERVKQIPGVKDVALASRAPFSFNFSRANIAVPGRQKAADEMGATINFALVSPTYFSTLGIGILEGRAFADSDLPGDRRVAIVSQAFARLHWPNESPIGRTVYERTLNSGRPLDIVGVAADHTQQNVGEAAQPAIYVSSTQRPSSYNVLIARTAGSDGALLGQVRQTLFALEPDLLLMESGTMHAQMQGMLFPVRVAAILVTAFSALGLALAAVGLYGIIAFSVAERTKEIGIRMAIGARPSTVIMLVLRQGVVLVTAGLIAGTVLGAVATTVLSGMLYGVSGADPIAWGAAASVLLVAGLAANAIPAMRAVRIDPVRALRNS
jgi:predicted permease